MRPPWHPLAPDRDVDATTTFRLLREAVASFLNVADECVCVALTGRSGGALTPAEAGCHDGARSPSEWDDYTAEEADLFHNSSAVGVWVQAAALVTPPAVRSALPRIDRLRVERLQQLLHSGEIVRLQ